MNTRYRHFLGVIGLALVILLLLGVLALQAPQTHASRAVVNDALAGSDIVARRAISIPFGIDSTLMMNADGTVIETTGHGRCAPNGLSFDVHVTLTQSESGARAKGNTQESCIEGEEQLWSATAETFGPGTFQEGAARACAQAVTYIAFLNGDGSFIVGWCKDVELVIGS